jgi:hypothetical protein
MLTVVLTPGEQRLYELADLVEKQTEYDQHYFFNWCGTPSCALGHWAAAHPERWTRVTDGDKLFPVLKSYLAHPEPLTVAQVYQVLHKQELIMRSACHEFDIRRGDYMSLFSAGGRGWDRTDNHKAAAFIREFTDKKVTARLSVE